MLEQKISLLGFCYILPWLKGNGCNASTAFEPERRKRPYLFDAATVVVIPSRFLFGGSELTAEFTSLSIFSRKQGSQYATVHPAFQPTTLSSSSKTELTIQKYSRQDKQVYLVVLKQEEHELSSLPAMMFENKLFAHEM